MTDDIMVEGVWLEHWYGYGKDHTLTRMDNSTGNEHVKTIAVRSDTLEMLHFRIRAKDNSSNWNESAVHDVRVHDNDAPVFIKDHTPTVVTTGDALVFDVEVSDNIQLDRIRVTFWEENATWVHYTSGPPKAPNRWWSMIFVSVDSLKRVHYFFTAFDNSSNTNRTHEKNVSVRDNDAPLLSNDLSPTVGYTGDYFNFSVLVTDNIGVDKVSVEYWYDNESIHLTSPMTYYWLMDQWNLSIEVQMFSMDTLHYIVYSYDASDNFNTSFVRHVEIRDNDPPTIDQVSIADHAMTGNAFSLSVVVSDNILTQGVFLEYWFGDSLVHDNESMGVGQSGTWGHVVYVSHYSVDPIHFRIHAVDNSFNWMTSDILNITVIDDDEPDLFNDLTTVTGFTGDPFNFVINVSDNIGISQVLIEYWYGDTGGLFEGEMIDLDGYNWTYGITLPIDTVEPIQYRVHALDLEGNVGTYDGREVEIIDNDDPGLGPDTMDPRVVKGLEHTFSISAFDNIGVTEVHLEYWFGVGEPIDISLMGAGTYSAVITIPRHPVGSLRYVFRATDAAGNSNYTTVTTIEPVNEPPRLLATPSLMLTEYKMTSLDLATYIFDANDPLSAIKLECASPNISVEGYTLVVVYTSWVPDHTVEITLSDGEDTTFVNITVSVLNVNDRPKITSVPSSTGRVGEDYLYQVRFYDLDPFDEHTLSLLEGPRGSFLDSRGLMIWRPTEGQYDLNHVVISVSDGDVSVEQSWDILVQRSPKDPDNQPPVFIGDVPRKASSGYLFHYRFEAVDPEGDTVFFRLLQGPGGSVIDRVNGDLRWTPPSRAQEFSELVIIVVEVTDGHHNVTNETTILWKNPSNQPPVIDGVIPNIATIGEYSIDLTKYMSDSDDSIADLKWEFSGGNDELFTCKLEGNKLIVTPKQNGNGQATVELVLRDPSHDFDTQVIVVDVAPWHVRNAAWLLIFIIIVLVVSFGIFYKMKWRKNPPTPDVDEQKGLQSEDEDTARSVAQDGDDQI